MPEFRKLAKDVYAFLQPPLVWYCSAGVIIGDRDVIVVDNLTNAHEEFVTMPVNVIILELVVLLIYFDSINN